MSETNNTAAGVITVPPKSTGFTTSTGTEMTDDVENQRRVQQQQDCPAYFCTEVCADPCADVCAELIRLLCCLRCWDELSSGGSSNLCCCCCEGSDGCCEGDCCGDCGECCGACTDCSDVCGSCCEG